MSRTNSSDSSLDTILRTDMPKNDFGRILLAIEAYPNESYFCDKFRTELAECAVTDSTQFENVQKLLLNKEVISALLRLDHRVRIGYSAKLDEINEVRTAFLSAQNELVSQADSIVAELNECIARIAAESVYTSYLTLLQQHKEISRQIDAETIAVGHYEEYWEYPDESYPSTFNRYLDFGTGRDRSAPQQLKRFVKTGTSLTDHGFHLQNELINIRNRMAPLESEYKRLVAQKDDAARKLTCIQSASKALSELIAAWQRVEGEVNASVKYHTIRNLVPKITAAREALQEVIRSSQATAAAPGETATTSSETAAASGSAGSTASVITRVLTLARQEFSDVEISNLQKRLVYSCLSKFVLDYIEKRNVEKDSFSLFGFYFSQSKAQKISAASALLRILEDGSMSRSSILDLQKKTRELQQGRLGELCTRIFLACHALETSPVCMRTGSVVEAGAGAGAERAAMTPSIPAARSRVA